MPEKMTINDIAVLAQVSKGTVSKVMNNRKGVGQETRQKIRNLIQEVNFSPNATALALSKQRSNNIALIIPHEAEHSLRGQYWSTIISAITQEASQSDYNLLLYTAKEEGALDELYSRILNDKKADGLIIGSELIDEKQIVKMKQEGLPFILIGKSSRLKHHFVDIDNAQAVHSALEHLLAQGYRNIAYLSGPGQYYYNEIRMTAYKNTMTQRGLKTFCEEADQYNEYDISQALTRLLNHKDLDALFVGGGLDFLFPMLEKIQKEGKQNLALLIFDDSRFLDFLTLPITAIRQPIETLGIEACRGILKMIENETQSLIQGIFKTSLTIRGNGPSGLCERKEQ